MADKDAISVEALRERVAYCPVTGALWTKHAGRRCTHKDRDGYITASTLGKTMAGHRVAWALHYGSWPDGVIDHINGNRADNRIENLRCVTQQLNRQNMRAAHKDSRTGYLGVTRTGARFRAQIYHQGRNKNLGLFDTPDAAHRAYVAAKRELHPGSRL